ncbi:MAG TPA: cupin domain-containing protein [Novosphingobium sp.]
MTATPEQSGELTGALSGALAAAPSEQALIGLLDRAAFGPGWAKKRPSIYPEPRTQFVPAHWRYAEGRAALDAARAFVSTELAERRNLIMINPHAGNDYGTARTLVAAYQLVRGGEQARSHRHVPNALRLVLDAAPETYTIVDGARVPMQPGDVLLTPNWHWHGHSNESPADAFWIDFLDVPLIHLLEPMFFELHPDWIEAGGPPAPDSPFRFAWSDTAPALRARPEERPGERWLQLGPPQMSTISLALRNLAPGTRLADPRTTESRIYAVIEGAGELTCGDRTFAWTRGDVLVVPGWQAAAWTAAQDSTLLCVSDRVLLETLGLLRVEA